jgi:hypothetical protein
MTHPQVQTTEFPALNSRPEPPFTTIYDRRTKDEYDILSPMARRPDPAEFDHPLNTEELKALSRGLARLSPRQIADAYRKAYEACRMDGDQLPKAAAIQELVTAWKLTRAWRLRRPVERS